MSEFPSLIVLAAIAAYCLLSKRIETSLVSLPMIFTGLGLLLGPSGIDVTPMSIDNGSVHLIAELTLILVLFSDASRVRFESLSAHSSIPVRMLLIGMPLTIAFGTLVAQWVSPDAPWTVALLVAAILTPTDAALGQSVVTNPNVPRPVSQGVNVESGLNDGLALPVVLIAAVLASKGEGTASGVHSLATFAVLQITLGPLAGIVVAYLAARVLDLSVNGKMTTKIAQGLYFLIIAFASYLSAEAIGGNGFLASFVAGLVFGNMLRAPANFIYEFMEGEGQLLTIMTFLIFGAVLAPIGLEHATFKTLALAIAFLTFVRILPIWLSLTGSSLSVYEKFFLGWFGPRGLASILFSLMVFENYEIPGGDEIAACVVLTVLLSIVIHGVTAAPFSNAFRRYTLASRS